MKLPRLHKLNALGVTHLLVPLLAIVAIGGIGSYLLTASHADSSQETCSANGKTYSGSKEYNCTWTIPVPVISGSNAKVDSFSKSSSNWILCQQESSVAYYKGSYYNRWWGYTLGDSGKAGWVNATYAHGGINNGTFENVPNCSGKYGAVPTLKSGTTGTPAPTPAPTPTPAPVTCATPGQTVAITGGTKCLYDGSVKCNTLWKAEYYGSSLSCVPSIATSGTGYSDWHDVGSGYRYSNTFMTTDGYVCSADTFDSYDYADGGTSDYYKWEVQENVSGGWLTVFTSNHFSYNHNRHQQCASGLNKAVEYRVAFSVHPYNNIPTYMHGTWWVWGYNHS